MARKKNATIADAIEGANVEEETVPALEGQAPDGGIPPWVSPEARAGEARWACPNGTSPEATIPGPTDPGWQDFVMGQFAEGELDPEGNPTAEACRLVAERLLGTIVSERVRTIQLPTDENSGRATVEVSVAIAWDNNPNDVRVFEDVADVYPGNMDPRYARFPTASAKTKALGRAYKSALKLRRVYTTEELASKEAPPVEVVGDPLIKTSQRRFIDKLCRELDIDVVKFINHGKDKYNDIIQVPARVADKMVKVLSDFQREEIVIPDRIRGYNINWEKGAVGT